MESASELRVVVTRGVAGHDSLVLDADLRLRCIDVKERCAEQFHIPIVCQMLLVGGVILGDEHLMIDLLELGAAEVSITMVLSLEGVKGALVTLCSTAASYDVRHSAEVTLCTLADCEDEHVIEEIVCGLFEALRHHNAQVKNAALRIFQKLWEGHAYTLLAFVDLGSASRYGVLEVLGEGDERTVAALAMHLANHDCELKCSAPGGGVAAELYCLTCQAVMSCATCYGANSRFTPERCSACRKRLEFFGVRFREFEKEVKIKIK